MMHKNRKKEKKIFIVLVILSIEILLLGIFCGNIDRRVDLVEFTKHCEETIATVYNIDKEISTVYRSDDKYGASAKYEYYFEYYMDEVKYNKDFYETTTVTSRHSQNDAKRSAEGIKPKYEIGDKFIIYCNTKNPEDWRESIGYLSQTTLNIFAAIIIGLRGIILGKHIMDYTKEKKEEKKLV